MNETKIIRNIIIAVILIVLIFMTVGTVRAGERGVRLRFSAVVGTVEQGLYFKLPFVEKVKKIDIKTRVVTYERENPLDSASKDLQDVKISTVVNYNIDPSKVAEVYARYYTVENFEEQVIRPAVRDTVKAVASRYTAEELVTKRADYAVEVSKILNERLADKFITIQQSNITNLAFSPAFTQAIEAKVTATQNAETAKNDLEKVKFEAQQSIEKAKAEAESIRIQAQAINAQGGSDYVKLQAIGKWNGVLPVQMIPNATVPFIDLK